VGEVAAVEAAAAPVGSVPPRGPPRRIRTLLRHR